MKKLLNRIAAGIAAAVMLIGSSPNVVHAEESYTLNINYHCGGEQLGGAEFTAVKAATADGKYVFVSPYDSSGFDADKITSDTAQEAAKKLADLYKEGGTKVTTGSDGKAKLSLTEPGLYLVMQTGRSGSSENYNYSSPIIAAVVDKAVTIEPKTSKIPVTPKEDTPSAGGVGAISVYKVDADDNSKYLQGAMFSLYKSDGTKVGTYTTNETGYFGVSYLAYGNYYLIEDKAPDGYIGGADKINFTLNSTTSYSNDYPWNIKVTNTAKEETVTPTPETPKDTPTPTQVIQTVVSKATGDASNLPLYCGIAAVAVVGIIGFVIYKKKHN